MIKVSEYLKLKKKWVFEEKCAGALRSGKPGMYVERYCTWYAAACLLIHFGWNEEGYDKAIHYAESTGN